MKLKFSGDVAIDRKHKFHKGIHEIPKELENHWYIQALIKGGHVEVLEEPAPPIEDKEPAQEKPVKESKKKAGAKKDE